MTSTSPAPSAGQGAPVRLETDAGVATITLDRPAAMNSLDLATKEALLAAVRTAAEDDAVRCVLLTGTGRAFCVGQDLKEHLADLRAQEDGSGGELGDTVREHYNVIATTLAQMPKPVVAALNGVAAGAGASLAFACDLRVLAESAGFNLAFAGIALSCDTGISWTLPRLIGSAAALELLYFPRTVPAAEALELGWPPPSSPTTGWPRRPAPSPSGSRPARPRRTPRSAAPSPTPRPPLCPTPSSTRRG